MVTPPPQSNPLWLSRLRRAFGNPSSSFKQIQNQGAGFTLIEMIIVLSVFAILSLVSGQIMSKVVNNFKTLNERGERLAAVHRAMGVMQRDIMQTTGRGVRDELGDTLQPVLLNATGELSFTRQGWQNPLQRPRSTLQRVAYQVADDKLMRAYWLALDRAPDSEPITQTLLEDVTAVEFLAVDAAGNERTFWPQGDATAGTPTTSVPATSGIPAAPATAIDPATRLVAIVVRLELEPFGELERIWMVPQWRG